MTDRWRRPLAELVGTFVLVFFAVGSAVFGLKAIGALGVALAFGLVLLALAYTFGPVSGCHVNPAVTLGVLLRGGISTVEAVAYWVAQFLGATVAAAMLRLMTSDVGAVTDQTGALGSNSWGKTVSGGGAFVFEVVGTFLLVFVVLMVTAHSAAPGFAGLAIGMVLAVIHLVGIPLDGTSVNPARSFGPAVFVGGDAMSQLWLFVVAPLLGGALAALASRAFETPVSAIVREERDERFDSTAADVPTP